VGNLATNFATVRVEEVQRVHTLTNSSGTSVVCASGYVPDDALPTGAAFQREIVSGLMFFLDSPQVDITTYHTEIVALLNDRAVATNNPCVFFASGHQRRGNRVYWFVRVVDETTNANGVAIGALDANLRSLVDGGLVVSGANSVIPTPQLRVRRPQVARRARRSPRRLARARRATAASCATTRGRQRSPRLRSSR